MVAAVSQEWEGRGGGRSSWPHPGEQVMGSLSPEERRERGRQEKSFVWLTLPVPRD